MNAYELADALDVESSQAEYGYVVDDWKLFSDSANMLRQQAYRIAELEKENKALHELVKQRIARNVELQNLLAPQTNAEPVAWINDENIVAVGKCPKDFIHSWKPLYTTPQTKPLNDEEIDDVINGTAWIGTEEEVRLKIARAIKERILGK